jgi:hypothetical protein
MPNRTTVHPQLDGGEVARTAARLSQRVTERFPETSLAKVSTTIHRICANAPQQIEELARPIWMLRSVSLSIGCFVLMLLLYLMLGGVEWSRFTLPNTFSSFIGLLEPALGSVVFLTAFFVFVGSLEQRWKQRRVLQALNGLRSLAHVIDMHQLTKDPERLMLTGPDTASSPERTFTAFQLGRYLDYCSEMLSILSKLSALWAQGFPEPRLVTAVDQIEMLTSGLSRKIWQKLMVLEAIPDTLTVKDAIDPGA